MSADWPNVHLEEVITQRKEFIFIDDLEVYKRCRVQLHAKGIVLRDLVPGLEIKTKKQQVCRAGEFLVAEIDAKVGGFGVVPDELDGAIVSSHYFLFEIDETKLDRKFLDFFIRTPNFSNQVNAQGSTNYAAIRPNDVLGYQIPLPPLDEQRRIVARIEELAARIEEAQKLRRQAAEEAEAMWVSALSVAYKPKEYYNSDGNITAEDLLREQAREYADGFVGRYNNAHPWAPLIESKGLYSLPKHWIWTNLGSILTRVVDCVNDTPDFSPNDTGFVGLKSTNIRPYKLDLSTKWFMTPQDFAFWNRREQPLPGDIILTREAPMGNACLIPDGIHVCLTQRLLLLRCDERFISNRYILHFLNSPHFQDTITDLCRGLTTPHIRVKDVPDITIPVPPLDEQRRIVARLDELQAQVDRLKKHQVRTAEELDALLPAVLERAFRGEL